MRRNYRESDQHKYKGFMMWGTGKTWICEPLNISTDEQLFWDIKNSQPELCTLKQAKKWIDDEGSKMLTK